MSHTLEFELEKKLFLVSQAFSLIGERGKKYLCARLNFSSDRNFSGDANISSLLSRVNVKIRAGTSLSAKSPGF